MISNPALGLWRRIRRRIAGTGLSLDTVADAQAQLTAIEADLPAYLWAYRSNDLEPGPPILVFD